MLRRVLVHRERSGRPRWRTHRPEEVSMRTTSRVLGIAALLAAPLLALADSASAPKANPSPKAQKAERAPCPMACNCVGHAARSAPAADATDWVQRLQTVP